MSATFAFSESNGATPTVTDGISNINFGSADAPNLVTTTYPVVAGTNSYHKAIRVKFTGIGTSISNMLFWKSAGALVSNEVIVAKNQASFVQPSQTTLAGASAVPTTSGTALTIHASNGINTSMTVDGYTEYILLQLQTQSITPAGAVNTKTFTFQYDEV